MSSKILDVCDSMSKVFTRMNYVEILHSGATQYLQPNLAINNDKTKHQFDI